MRAEPENITKQEDPGDKCQLFFSFYKNRSHAESYASHVIYNALSAYEFISNLLRDEKVKEKKQTFRQRMDRAASDLCIDTFESFSLRMNSSGELFISGCSRIIKCTEEIVCVKGNYAQIEIRGSALHLAVYSEKETIITGLVREIRFDREGK